MAGLFDYLSAAHPGSALLGFAGGTLGLFANAASPLSVADVADVRNQGGYHLLGRSVDRIRTPAEVDAALAACAASRLDALVLVGGARTATDAALLAEAAAARGAATAVLAVPVTIDGDLAGDGVEACLGFDTASKVYSELVGNLETDCNSAKKYYYFVRLMGRAPSHIALEVALQTRPQGVVIGEDVAARGLTLTALVSELTDVVVARAAAGKNFGVFLVPEGAISYIPELRALIAEVNAALAGGAAPAAVPGRLSPWSAALFASLPPVVRAQLLLERESSGAVQLSQVSSERVLAEMVGDELARRKAAGGYGGKYAPLSFFFGYQARSALPSNFDAAYGAALGRTAGALAGAGANGYLAAVRGLAGPVARWQPAGVPLAALATPAAGGRPAVESAPVDLHSPAFRAFAARRAGWAAGEAYVNPGPIQFYGPCADDVTATLAGARHDYAGGVRAAVGAAHRAVAALRDGVPDDELERAAAELGALADRLEAAARAARAARA